MSLKTRSVSFFEGQILKVLSKGSEITTYLGLASLSVGEGIRNFDEQFNYDVALQNLISRKKILKIKDKENFTIYKLVA